MTAQATKTVTITLPGRWTGGPGSTTVHGLWMSPADSPAEPVADATPARGMLSVEATATRLGISRGLAYRGVREGAIPSVRIGRRLLVPVVALERLLAGEA